MRILLADELSEDIEDALKPLSSELKIDPTLKDESLVEALAEFQPSILVVRSTKVQLQHFEACPSLALVIRAGAGTNTIDCGEASRRGIYVANCPGCNAIAVAELTIGHLVNLDRRIADNVLRLRENVWSKKEFAQASGLYGRSLAVLGTGQIGQEVIKRANSFGMKIRAWSRSLTPKKAERLGVQFAATVSEACEGADALTVHLELTDDTRHLVDIELMKSLKPGAMVINTSRGEIVKTDDLMQAVKERNIRAGLDVYENEPSSGDTSFSGPEANCGSVYGTHHIAASTIQASEAVASEVVRIIQEYGQNGIVPNCVNLIKKSPSTHWLVIRHVDKVGVLASMLNVLREAGINVQEMQNVVFQGAQAACARLHIDSPPKETVIKYLEELEHIIAVSLAEEKTDG
ncbi:MAG: NAD(P)-dependent oxidoreductase [Myxococcota bacterium]|nr:NAD(P)-dependent oxidoreductase [Myxococcota bacterium]